VVISPTSIVEVASTSRRTAFNLSRYATQPGLTKEPEDGWSMRNSLQNGI